MDILKGWRTLGFNVLAAILTVIQATDLTPLLPPKYLWVNAIVIPLVNVALRYITTTPLGVK